MSDAAPQTEQDSIVPAPGSTPAASARPAPGKLPMLALLLGAGGLLLGGWSLWQVRALHDADLQQLRRLEEARGESRALAERELLTSRQLEQLPSASELAQRARLLGDLQAGQQRLAQQVDRVLGASRQEWRLAEAEHLLRLASLRLSALQDVNSARFLVSAADQILRDHDDPAAFAARQELARALEALRSLPAIDRTGLYLQLAALGEQAARLNTRAPEFVAVTGGLPAAAQVAEGDGASRWAEWWQRLSGFVRLQFTASDEVKPLLAGQTLEQLRLALRLGIEQAQWAVLNAQPQVYHGALEQARVVLQRYFGLDTAANQGLYDRLGELAGQPVAQALPDLTPALNALQAYLGQRERAELEAAGVRKAGEPAKAAPSAAETPAAPAGDAQPAEAGQ
ncbi:MAG TPA: uroporphyrinogen-III C-methyltransferase [Pseudomonas sp.]|nr:uroporphyrinogen-III C-methyltransferase [Pseudomonas sp.]